MKELATESKRTIIWFYGFKMHIVINYCDIIIRWLLITRNEDNRKPLKNPRLYSKTRDT